MQKKYKLITLALSSFLLLGCEPKKNDSHVHKYSDSWSRDSEEHYHTCTFEGCTSKSDVEAHTFGDDGKCTVCGFYDKTKVVIDPVEEDIIYVGTKEGHYKIDANGNRISDTEPHVLVDFDGDGGAHQPIAATCTLPGKRYQKCSVCSKYVEVVVAALGHDWGNWNTIQPATTTEKGVKERQCARCNEVERADIDILVPAHVHTFESAWQHDGNMHWHKATCGHDVRGNEEPHSYGDWETVVAPTETQSGTKRKTCEVCGYYVDETIPATGVVSASFSFNSDIIVAQKIHTTDQENFLNYNKDYYNITSSELNSYNATGNAEKSFPNQVTLTWNYTVPSGKTIKNYSIVTGQEADLSDGYTITGTTSKSISFYNPFLGTNYFKVVANFTDNTSESSPIKTFLVDATAPRNVKIDTMSNCRDMGGRTNVSGGKIRQGLIYRTAETGSNPSQAIKEEMLNRFKVKSEIYVKDGRDSSSPLGSGVKFFNCSMDYGSVPYSNMCRNAERLRKVFSVLGDVNNYPLFYHCRIGTDRTGICGVAINGVLGVPFNEVIQDYAFSNFGKIDGQRYAHKSSDPNGDDCAKYIDEILAMPGKNFQEQTIYYLLTIGVPAKTIQNVINIMTVGNKVTIPTDIVVANGSNLATVGGTTKTANDYTHPDTYYQISGASQNVNFKYTLSEAKEVTVVAYLGSTDSSSSKKLADGIDLKIDDASKTLTNTKTYNLAGFGSTKQNGRTGYMFNILGKYSLTAGEHTITLAGKNSDKFNIGGISIIGANATIAPGESGSSQGGNEGGNGGNGGGNQTTETVVASWLVNTETAKNNVSTGSNDNGTYYKLTENSSYVEYKFNSTVAGKAYLKANAGTKAGNATSSHKLWYDESKSAYKFVLTVNGATVAFTDQTTSFSDVGMGNTKSSGSASGSDSGDPVWVEFPEITIKTGENTIKLQRNSGYTLYFYEFKVVTK